MKIVCSDPKSGKTMQIEIKEDAASYFINKKIGEIVEGSILDLPGYKLKITGGSDKSGFSLNKSISGTVKTKVLRKQGKNKNAIYRRRIERGNIIASDTEQVNTVIVEYGDKPVESIFPQSQPKDKEEKSKA
ncbi:MAG: S6e family ribosomal protein [Candidatus Micrarchaeia archaeon]